MCTVLLLHAYQLVCMTQVFKGKATKKHRLVWTWFNTAYVPLEQDLYFKDLDHSRSLSAGSLSSSMFTVWTKVLKVCCRLVVLLRVHV